MPRKVTAYACEFGCGKRVNTSAASIARHEATCKLNPARRACATCKHEARNEIGRFCCDLDLEQAGRSLLYNCASWEVA